MDLLHGLIGELAKRVAVQFEFLDTSMLHVPTLSSKTRRHPLLKSNIDPGVSGSFSSTLQVVMQVCFTHPDYDIQTLRFARRFESHQ